MLLEKTPRQVPGENDVSAQEKSRFSRNFSLEFVILQIFIPIARCPHFLLKTRIFVYSISFKYRYVSYCFIENNIEKS